MRKKDHVWQRHEPDGYSRFMFIDVKAGSRDGFCLKRRYQGGLVDDRAARRVDEKGSRFHQSKPAPVDEMMSGLGERNMKRNKIRPREYVIERATSP
jgi:hypothetical protein